MNRAHFFLTASALLLAPVLSLFPLEVQSVLDVMPTAVLVREGGAASDPLVQTETTEITAQTALSQSQPLAQGLSLSGTFWSMADSLPSRSPLDTPPAKIDLEARVLELELTWEALPGMLIFDAGKRVIHPSSGFFRTPLNVISHGSLGNGANLTGSAVGTWEEGWVGAGVTVLLGDVTLSDFFSPRLQWSTDADSVLRYLTTQQENDQNLSQVDIRLGGADLRLLGLLSTGGPGSADPALHFTAGAGLDTNVGDALTLRAEVSAADSANRMIVTGSQGSSAIATQTLKWAPRALVGFTWTNQDQLSVMGEYAYDGLGFLGNDYAELLAYSQSAKSTSAAAPDLLDQFGSFNAARHYLFLRLSDKIDDKLTAAGWTTVNAQDGSGLTGIDLTLANDKWNLNAYLTNAWGGQNTEGGLSPLLWTADVEVNLFF